ncbi:MAG: transporter [Elusimicrobia bacterium]|nr:transporter [Elusimicrobiota bacterium]
MKLIFFAAAAVLAVPHPAAASCGAMGCTIEHERFDAPRTGRARLDLALQYVDQNIPRALGERAPVGLVPNPDHDEVRTLSRIWMARFDYDAGDRWGVGLALPVVSRFHEHVDVASGDRNAWRFTGIGDLLVELRWTVWRGEGARKPAVALTAGGKFPTGRTGAHNDFDAAEVPLQPGSGSYDAIAGAVYTQNFGRGAGGRDRSFFARAAYRKNGPGSRRYQLGDEFQATVGAALPVLKRLDLDAQASLRVRRKDQPGDTPEDVSFTGGEYVHLSPGVRWHWGGGLSTYGYLQLPVHQRVNREQLTADRAWVFGATWEFAAPAL